VSADERRLQFSELHTVNELFVMPNPWDVGSARLLATLGFKALATTSAGFAWSLGQLDQTVSRDRLIRHVRKLVGASPLPLNVDSERCYPDAPGGVAGTVAMLADAGASGFSVEDYDPASGRIDDISVASERVACAAEVAHSLSVPLVVTGRAENHIRGVDDLEDTIKRLVAYRDAGADVLYAPGLVATAAISRVVEAVASPVNVLLIPGGPSLAELAELGVGRVSTGSALAFRAYACLVAEARALLETGTYRSDASQPLSREMLKAALASDKRGGKG
jgi:2-methylisocitrate lyase-like PEP mutase family enzyme